MFQCLQCSGCAPEPHRYQLARLPMTHSRGRVRSWLGDVGALEWLYLAVGLGLVHEYRWLFDDAFVYFRYVDNLVLLDLGLVYNAGEYVEGFSSPAHAMVLIVLRSLGLPFSTAIWLMGYLALVAFWAALVECNRRWSPPGARLNAPLALMCANYGLTTYFTSGLETPLVHAVAACYALAVAAPGTRLAPFVVYASPLVRPDLALPLAIYLLWRARTRGERLKHLLAWPAALNGAWLIFRIYYYAELLPNTFYLKDDVELATGLRYVWDLVSAYYVVGALAVGLAVFAWRVARSRPFDAHLRERALLALLASSSAAYVVKVGGSPVHYWYLAFPFTLGLASLGGLFESALSARGLDRGSWQLRGGMVLIVLVSFSLYPRQLSSHPALSSPKVTRPGMIHDAEWHRRHPGLAPGSFEPEALAALQRARAADIAHRGYLLWKEGNWCRNLYTNIDRGVVHSLGLTEKFLAHATVPELIQGHKVALVPLAHDLVVVRRREAQGVGMHRAAVAAGYAAPWIRQNLPAIELIEAKVYNQKALLANFVLAFTPTPAIVP